MLSIARRLASPLARIGAVVGALTVAACQPVSLGQTGPATGPQIDPSQPVPVALLVPTGSAELDWLGRSLANSARMAAADSQGARIDLRVYTATPGVDDNVAKARQAVADGAQIIIGPLFAEPSNAVGNAVRESNINVISFSNNSEIAGGNVFVLGNTFDNVAGRLVKYGVDNGKRRILVVAEDDVAGQIGANAIQRAISRNGAVMSGQAKHPVSRTGIDGIVPQIDSAVKSGNIDAVFITANQEAVLPYLTDRLAETGTTRATQLMGLTRWDVPAARLQLPGVQGGWFALPDTQLKGQYETRYRSAHGEAPHELGSLGYDGVAAIGALVRAGRRDALTTNGLTSSSGFSGINGIFRLRPDGTNERGLAVATIRNGQVVTLDPAPRSFGGFGF